VQNKKDIQNIIPIKCIKPKTSNSIFETIKYIHGEEIIKKEYGTYLMDESKFIGEAEYLFFPKNEAELIHIANFLVENQIKIYCEGTRTGITGSCVPLKGAIISMENMNKILGFDYDDSKKRFFLKVEPGITLKEINEFLASLSTIIDNKINIKKLKISQNTINAYENLKKSKQTLYYPVDPTEMSASIGGTIATNASGAATFKYGPTRDWIKKIRVMIFSTNKKSASRFIGFLDIPRGKYFANNKKFILKFKEETDENTSKDENTKDKNIKDENTNKNSDLVIQLPDYNFNTDVKNAAGIYVKEGMDFIDLFIGSEGIFGIITEIEIWLTKKPSLLTNVMFFEEENDALIFTEYLRQKARNKELDVEFIEFFSKEALDLIKNIQQNDFSYVDMPKIPNNINSAIFFDIAYKSLDKSELEYIVNQIEEIASKSNSSSKNTWSSYEKRDFKRFKHFRHLVPEKINEIIALRKRKYAELHKLGTDMSVPDKYLRDIVKFYRNELNKANLEYVMFGHIGNNHIHVNILPKNLKELEIGEKIYEKFAKRVVDYGGSISAEHGIGKIKKRFLKFMYSEKDIQQMKELKRQFDPMNLLNPENLF